jgi:hypothetical protein
MKRRNPGGGNRGFVTDDRARGEPVFHRPYPANDMGIGAVPQHRMKIATGCRTS